MFCYDYVCMIQANRLSLDADVRDIVDQVVEELVNHVAHDIRNYAFAIGLQAELGARHAADPLAARSHFEAVSRQLDKLKSYLEHLLLFGRPFKPQPVVLEPVALLQETAQYVSARLANEGPPPVIEVVAQGDTGRVVWDRHGMHAAFAALLDNALRSAPAPPPVHVIVEPAGEQVRITVRDEGCGMDAATLAALSQPMAVRRPGGAGLGLAIARKMVRAQGGQLSITSGPGGTTVCLEIPREPIAQG